MLVAGWESDWVGFGRTQRLPRRRCLLGSFGRRAIRWSLLSVAARSHVLELILSTLDLKALAHLVARLRGI